MALFVFVLNFVIVLQMVSVLSFCWCALGCVVCFRLGYLGERGEKLPNLVVKITCERQDVKKVVVGEPS